MIGAHFSISALRCLLKAAGVARFLLHGLGAEVGETLLDGRIFHGT